MLSMQAEISINSGTNIMYKIIIRNPDESDLIVPIHEATFEQKTKWLNQATSFADRNQRKALLHSVNYNMGPQKFLEAYAKEFNGTISIKGG
jgi:hypothetical protein